MSFDQHLRTDRLERRERAVQRKIERGGSLTPADRRVVQAKMTNAVQAMQDLPPGAQVVPGGTSDSGAVISALQSAAAGMVRGGARPPAFASLPIVAQIAQILASGLQPRAISQQIASTAGINSNWNVTIRFGLAAPGTPQSQGTGQTTIGTSGTGGNQTTTGTQNTDTGGGTGSVGSKDGPNAGASGSSSTASSSSNQATATGTATSGTQTTDTMQRFTAPLQADIQLHAELDLSGSDYINPFKWGEYIGEAIEPMQDASVQVNCGTIIYQTSAGIAPPAAAAPAPAH